MRRQNVPKEWEDWLAGYPDIRTGSEQLAGVVA